MIKISVQLFGALKKYSRDNIQLELEKETSVSKLKELVGLEIEKKHADFSDHELLSLSALATEDKVLQENSTLLSDSNLALLPPVCGG